MESRDLKPEYLQSDYVVHLSPERTVVLHHGQPAPDVDRWIADTHPDLRQWMIITAWNPDSEPQPTEKNRLANEQLREEFRKRRWPFLEAVGQLGDWREESLLVLIPSREDGLEFGRRYGQVAVVLGARGELAEVTLCERPAGSPAP